VGRELYALFTGTVRERVTLLLLKGKVWHQEEVLPPMVDGELIVVCSTLLFI